MSREFVEWNWIYEEKQCLIKTLNLMQVNTKFLVCSLIYMGSLSANAVGSSSLANETVHVSILSVDQTKMNGTLQDV